MQIPEHLVACYRFGGQIRPRFKQKLYRRWEISRVLVPAVERAVERPAQGAASELVAPVFDVWTKRKERAHEIRVSMEGRPMEGCCPVLSLCGYRKPTFEHQLRRPRVVVPCRMGKMLGPRIR